MKDEQLGDGLVLRSVRDEHDIRRYVAMTAAVNGGEEAATGERLLRHHPGMSGADFFFVEDTRTDEIVSTTCLIPWRYHLQGIEIRAAMLEMVGTRPAYRKRGLVRAQMERFQRAADEGGYDLCIIQGIPFYYRQYGYSYALDAWSYDSLPSWSIPGPYDALAGSLTVRPAVQDDIPALAQLYAAENAGLGLSTLRDAAYWRYLLDRAGWEVRAWTDAAGVLQSYAYTTPLKDRAGLRVHEARAKDARAAQAMLADLKGETAGELRISWPASTNLVQLARSLGSVPKPTYQWLIRFPDVAAWLRRLGPLFARRLAASSYAGLSDELVLNLFKQAFALRFEGGQLCEVRSLGFVDASMNADGGDLCIPLDAFVRLSLGYRDLDQLVDAWPDTVIKSHRRHLWDVLFPKMSAYLLMPY